MSTEQSKVQYIADGINTEFQTPFCIFLQDGIKIFFNEEQVDSKDYSVALDSQKKATITFLTAPISNTLITITRALPVVRTTQFQEGGALRASSLNYEFDYQMACLQDVADGVQRAMTYPPYAVSTDIDLTLPLPDAGKSIVWSADGKRLENSSILVNNLESQLKDYKEEAEASAIIAQTAANLATEKSLEVAIISEDITEAMQNIDTKINSNEVMRLLEIYQNGQNWYKIFEETQLNGTKKYWCEQGGISGSVARHASLTVNYFVPLIITTPPIVSTPSSTYNSSASNSTFSTISYNNSGFTITSGAVSSSNYPWTIKGYCNKPEENI